jgi:hypothetical protein
MANTRALTIRVEEWFRDYLRGQNRELIIEKGETDLKWGGQFECDAICKDKEGNVHSVYCLSTSEYLTAGGKGGSGKLNKIKGDILMLSGTYSPRKFLALIGKTMADKIISEQGIGRLPNDINVLYINLSKLNPDLYKLVLTVRKKSIKEVTPKGDKWLDGNVTG